MSLASQFGYRTALVTGASAGLGREFADMLRREGLEVWGTSRDPGRIPAGDGLHPVALDLREPASVLAAVEQVRAEAGVPDVLVNNAGAGVFAAFAHFPVEEVGGQLRLLLEGPLELTRAFWPEMLERRRGALVLVSSLAAEFPLPGFSVYSAAKAGLSGFAQALMLESAGRGVQVLDFQPGDYRTNFNRAARHAPAAEAWENRVWAEFDKWIQQGADPAKAAGDLRRALAAGRSGTVTSGLWFQATGARLLQRIAGHSALRRIMRKMYRMDG